MKEANKPFVLWLLGLSGSGKSTLSEEIKKRLDKLEIKVENLDGDVLREMLPNTGFDKISRVEHNKRAAFLASLLEKNGVSVIVSLIAPYQESRDYANWKCNNYVEIFVDASIEECEKRDVKGLYKKVRDGEIKNFTGIDDPFEIPNNPALIIKTADESLEQSADKIMKLMQQFL